MEGIMNKLPIIIFILVLIGSLSVAMLETLAKF